MSMYSWSWKDPLCWMPFIGPIIIVFLILFALLYGAWKMGWKAGWADRHQIEVERIQKGAHDGD